MALIGATPAVVQANANVADGDAARSVKIKKSEKKQVEKARAAKGASERVVVSGEGGRLEGDIVVTGLRENVKVARTAKRRAQQIVDVVVAQDIGRLPDKNVPETLARIPGVQIDRERGEGANVRIRGLGGVMTTVNGSPTFSAGDRTTYLQDISSDLVGAIEVFKTRTPDQTEGSQTGVINISLRRPTDFKPGTTVAINLAGDYPDQVKKVNPYASALFVQNGDTAIGRVGYSINATYQKIDYLESRRWNGGPRSPTDPRQIVDPSGLPTGIIMPDRVGFTYVRGQKIVGEVRLSTNWRPDDNWQVIVEGGASDQRMDWRDDQFDIPILYSESAAPPPRLSNVVLVPNSRVVSSATVQGVDPFGPGKQSYLHNTRNYSGRFQVEYKDDRIDFSGWVNYQRSNNYSNALFNYVRFSQNPSFDVEFNTSKDPRGGSNVTFKGIDLLNPKNYAYIDGYYQDRQYTLSAETEVRGDLRVNTFGNIIDYIKIGYRYANRNYDRKFGGRNQGNLRIPISAIPGYELVPAGQGFSGTATASNANWLTASGPSFRDNWDKIRQLIAGVSPASNNIANYYPDYNLSSAFNGSDGSIAAYGMFHYKLDLFVPVEGIIGVRAVNTLTNLQSNSANYTLGPGGALVLDVTTTNLRGNYLNVLPSMNAIAHFTDNLQLRASWTKDFGRPSSYQLSPFRQIDARNPNSVAILQGNDQLRGIDIRKYDLSLEWYFGKTGSLSLAAWRWEQDGFVQNRTNIETLPSFTTPVLVTKPFNAGRGQHKGIELAGTTFFTFLPGFLNSFGASGNFTYNDTQQAFPTINPTTKEVTYIYGPYTRVSKYIYNIIGFFERGGLNVRVTYNWRSRREETFGNSNFFYNQFYAPVDRLDFSVNYDVSKNLTLAFQATNLLRSGENLFWGTRDLPRDVTYYSRNFNASVRLKL